VSLKINSAVGNTENTEHFNYTVICLHKIWKCTWLVISMSLSEVKDL